MFHFGFDIVVAQIEKFHDAEILSYCFLFTWRRQFQDIYIFFSAFSIVFSMHDLYNSGFWYLRLLLFAINNDL